MSGPELVASAPAVAPAKQNAIQIIEQKVVEFIKQRETAIANLHAVEGAIQGAQNILATLRVEAAKAEQQQINKELDEKENDPEKL